jgi:hypothetical protein
MNEKLDYNHLRGGSISSGVAGLVSPFIQEKIAQAESVCQ